VQHASEFSQGANDTWPSRSPSASSHYRTRLVRPSPCAGGRESLAKVAERGGGGATLEGLGWQMGSDGFASTLGSANSRPNDDWPRLSLNVIVERKVEGSVGVGAETL
jgi:hypothetical protein